MPRPKTSEAAPVAAIPIRIGPTVCVLNAVAIQIMNNGIENMLPIRLARAKVNANKAMKQHGNEFRRNDSNKKKIASKVQITPSGSVITVLRYGRKSIVIIPTNAKAAQIPWRRMRLPAARKRTIPISPI
jgi:hypothetical protein